MSDPKPTSAEQFAALFADALPVRDLFADAPENDDTEETD